jgi:iron complex transport system substrate-binding protein
MALCLLLLSGWNEAAYCSPDTLPPKRIVSLAPAMTEIIFSLGLGERVVGVTSVCDRPAEARSKTKVGGMANPSIEAIVFLKPDMVVLSRDGNPKIIADRLAKLGIKTHVFTARRLTGLPAGIREMGQALGARPAANRLAESIETAIRKANALPGRKSVHPGAGAKTLFVIWPSPLIVAGPGTIMDDAMAVCGLRNIASDAKVPYPRFSLETIIERRPDLIVIGKGHDDMKKLSKGLLSSLGMLEAVRKGRVCFMDDALYRPGPRIPTGMEDLKRCGNIQ